MDILLWLGVGRCGWLGVDRCGWVWMGVVSKDFKGFLFVMHFCQFFVVLAGCGWVWLGVAGGVSDLALIENSKEVIRNMSLMCLTKHLYPRIPLSLKYCYLSLASPHLSSYFIR